MTRLLNNDPREIEKAIRGPRDAPLGLKPYADAASLPLAAEWPHCLVYVKDIEQPAISDGADWFPITLGAAL